jgi:hypothetical protein
MYRKGGTIVPSLQGVWHLLDEQIRRYEEIVYN